MTTLLLLAAGQSKRFGAKDKLLSDVGGVPLVVRTARQIATGWTRDRLAVVSSVRVQALLEAEGWVCLLNDAPERGQASSLKIGVQAVDGPFIIALADMPFVTAAHIAKIDAAGDCVMSLSDKVLLPPAKFGQAHRAALLALDGDSGAKSVFLSVGGVSVDMHPEMARDIDYPSQEKPIKGDA